jgi:hypothetical protein
MERKLVDCIKQPMFMQIGHSLSDMVEDEITRSIKRVCYRPLAELILGYRMTAEDNVKVKVITLVWEYYNEDIYGAMFDNVSTDAWTPLATRLTSTSIAIKRGLDVAVSNELADRVEAICDRSH